jgi:hypothetical protein
MVRLILMVSDKEVQVKNSKQINKEYINKNTRMKDNIRRMDKR